MSRKLLSLAIILLSQSALAANITCYSGGKEIYKGAGKHVRYIPGEYLSFVDKKTKNITFVQAECIIQAAGEKDLA